MKTILSFATTVACLAIFTLSAQAEQNGTVAVIDISKIFKEHKRFRQSLEDMKKDVAAAEATHALALRTDVAPRVEARKRLYQDLHHPHLAVGNRLRIGLGHGVLL